MRQFYSIFKVLIMGSHLHVFNYYFVTLSVHQSMNILSLTNYRLISNYNIYFLFISSNIGDSYVDIFVELAGCENSDLSQIFHPE